MERKGSSSDLVKTSEDVSNGKKGGLKTMPFIIANEALERLASVGLSANMIMYLKNEYHLTNARGQITLLWWGAISNFTPIFGAFLSDSYLGRYYVIALGTFISFLGMVVLWLTAIIKEARPHRCKLDSGNCQKPDIGQLALLLSSFALMAIGAGGIRPCSLAFGADQVDNPENPNNGRILQSFFNWYYASVCISVLIAVTVIVYIQTQFGWVVGFGVPAGLMLLATIFFLLGFGLFIKMKAKKSLIPGLAQVVAMAWKNKHLSLPPVDSNGWYHHEKDSTFTFPTHKLRFLNKACIIRNPEKDLNPNGTASDQWNLCTVQQVEELKALIKVIPMWSTGIMIAVTLSQHAFPVLQANTMDRHLNSHFEIPAASYGLFAIITLTIWIAIYDRILVPWMSKFTKKPRGLTFKQRIGIGLLFSCAAQAVAALVERERRARAHSEGLEKNPFSQVNMSAFWLVPQHCLTGLAEAFNAIGQIEFYYSQFPKSMASIGVALFSLGLGFGNLVGSLIVEIVDHVSSKGGKVSWVSNNLNLGHYDYYYWVLCLLSVGNLFYFIVCAWAYGSDEDTRIWEEDQAEKKGEIVML
ncbi:protein NRT1/ PTR FAMILY 1.1-like [Nicotiana sylvestris]|uniref:Protein NRT1/ PTR FAMILY 1.1-like n=1 Tax=Nicotiana sylvestris TaxID=4096 RepID=A0A1U7W7Y0_NICSY|nr:PREDICTED: protein NRT1/ PTR FAMILY 1.1-like [Nicotiana sylvestris]